jgi:hypothetical protein
VSFGDRVILGAALAGTAAGWAAAGEDATDSIINMAIRGER